MKTVEKTLKEVLEELKDNSFGVINIEEHNEPEMEFIVEVKQSRYDELVACEQELMLLRQALSVVNAYDLGGIRKIFGIEKRGEE
jgi:hypothetical protein